MQTPRELFLLLGKLQALEQLHLGRIGPISAKGFELGSDSRLKELIVCDLRLDPDCEEDFVEALQNCWSLEAFAFSVHPEARLTLVTPSSFFCNKVNVGMLAGVGGRGMGKYLGSVEAFQGNDSDMALLVIS